MESLKSVAEKVKRSPQVIRKKLGGGGQYKNLQSAAGEGTIQLLTLHKNNDQNNGYWRFPLFLLFPVL